MTPEPENVAKLHSLASWLAQSLARELLHLGFKTATPHQKDVYDSVYLPRLVAFSEHAGRYKAVADLQILCQPLHRDLASTQLRIVLELIQFTVLAL